jgi:hypothetical protein
LRANWLQIDPARGGTLTDARLQLHHAVQLAASAGISYLAKRSDDSHTNFEWIGGSETLASNPIPAGTTRIRVGICVADFTVAVLSERGDVRASHPLIGETVAGAAAWLRSELQSAGLEGSAFTLARHYEIPDHAVARGGRFDPARADLGELSRWFANGAAVLQQVRSAERGASEVRCWPHHFDIATLITLRPEKTVGVGLEPGDVYYDEPYFYVNARPQPRVEALPETLAGGGFWHTHEWIGAVLPASRLPAHGGEQLEQVTRFLASAVPACKALVG